MQRTVNPNGDPQHGQTGNAMGRWLCLSLLASRAKNAHVAVGRLRVLGQQEVERESEREERQVDERRGMKERNDRAAVQKRSERAILLLSDSRRTRRTRTLARRSLRNRATAPRGWTKGPANEPGQALVHWVWGSKERHLQFGSFLEVETFGSPKVLEAVIGVYYAEEAGATAQTGLAKSPHWAKQTWKKTTQEANELSHQWDAE